MFLTLLFQIKVDIVFYYQKVKFVIFSKLYLLSLYKKNKHLQNYKIKFSAFNIPLI